MLAIHTLLWLVLHRTRGCCPIALWHQSSLTVARSLGPSRCLLKPELRTDKAVSQKPTPVRYYWTGYRSGAYGHSEFIICTLIVLLESIFVIGCGSCKRETSFPSAVCHTCPPGWHSGEPCCQSSLPWGERHSWARYTRSMRDTLGFTTGETPCLKCYFQRKSASPVPLR